MPKYRSNLPLTSSKLFLTDGGIETTLDLPRGLELPHFAAFDLLKSRRRPRGAARATTRPMPRIARANGVGFVLESADLARQRGLGREARLLAERARRRQPQGDRA